jgi:phage-related protein
MGLIFQRASTGFLQPINSTVDKVIAASNGITCLVTAIFGIIPSPASVISAIGGIAAGLAASIVDAVTKIIYEKVDQIINSVLSPLRQIEAAINDLTKVLESAQYIAEKAFNLNNYFKNKQNCAAMGATLLNCLVQNAMNQITNKVAMEVDKHASKIANNVSKEAFKVNGTIKGYIDRNTKFLEKASLQNKLLT